MAAAAGGGRPAGGKKLRVWLPDIVLPAGDRLRAAIEGDGGVNFVHLRRKHPAATFRLFGAANVTVPPWKRLQVIAQCPSGCSVEAVESDVLDLAETACDIVADGLGLTDDQVQQAFEEIRVERSDVKVAPPKASTEAEAAAKRLAAAFAGEAASRAAAVAPPEGSTCKAPPAKLPGYTG